MIHTTQGNCRSTCISIDQAFAFPQDLTWSKTKELQSLDCLRKKEQYIKLRNGLSMKGGKQLKQSALFTLKTSPTTPSKTLTQHLQTVYRETHQARRHFSENKHQTLLCIQTNHAVHTRRSFFTKVTPRVNSSKINIVLETYHVKL